MKQISTANEEKLYRIARTLEIEAGSQNETLVWIFVRVIINQIEAVWFDRAKEYYLVFGAAFSSTNN